MEESNKMSTILEFSMGKSMGLSTMKQSVSLVNSQYFSEESEEKEEKEDKEEEKK